MTNNRRKAELEITQVPQGKGYLGMALVDGKLTDGTEFDVSLTAGGLLNVMLIKAGLERANYLVSFDGIIEAVHKTALRRSKNRADQ